MKSHLPLVVKDNGIPEHDIPETGQQEKNQFPHNHLQTLLDGFCDFRGVENYGLSFKGLSLNSKKVHEEFLFLACAGSADHATSEVNNKSQHGIAYAGDAIKRGANCIVWEPTQELESMPASCVVKDKPDVPLIKVVALHDKVGEIAARFYQHPSREMNVIGITGTNGKTSTAHFIAQIIHGMGTQKNSVRCAVIGTLGNGIYGDLEVATHTTPDAVTLQALMSDFKGKQADFVVMEVSSHALAQGRVNGVEFDSAIFTNLTRDHLDYHGDMKRYADEKLKLFQVLSLKHIVVNQDDQFSKEIITSVSTRRKEETPEVVSYSRHDKTADFYARDIHLDRAGISFTLSVSENIISKNETQKNNNFPVNCNLVGDFNVENLLAAIAVLQQRGYDLNDIISTIASVTTVPGRMEKIIYDDAVEPDNQSKLKNDELPLIVVDYAHTPDALEKSLKALRAHTQGKLYCVFGCGGDRDKGKRPLMAKVAQAQADNIMVTSDNPRTESAQQIIKEITTGFNSQEKISTEIEREQAIRKVLELADADDVVLIAGKGHEDYQEINGVKLPFSDKGCVLSILSGGIH